MCGCGSDRNVEVCDDCCSHCNGNGVWLNFSGGNLDGQSESCTLCNATGMKLESVESTQDEKNKLGYSLLDKVYKEQCQPIEPAEPVSDSYYEKFLFKKERDRLHSQCLLFKGLKVGDFVYVYSQYSKELVCGILEGCKIEVRRFGELVEINLPDYYVYES